MLFWKFLDILNEQKAWVFPKCCLYHTNLNFDLNYLFVTQLIETMSQNNLR